MQKEKLYSIGEVSRICNISKKALLFYDQIGIITPDVICKENGYRYYNRETLLTVPIVKYYKQMGFKLEEMQDLVEGNTYYFVKQNFISKIDELRIQEQEIHNSYMAVKDWYELIQEAQPGTQCFILGCPAGIYLHFHLESIILCHIIGNRICNRC